MRLVVLYGGFAALGTAINIGAQDLVVRFYRGPLGLVVSLAFGTVAGLLVKYALDKRYVFRDAVRAVAAESRLFHLYSGMGVVTTVLFWSVEFAFDYAFDSLRMRYVGGILGLAVGYTAKFQLDKRFVFTG